MLDKVSKKIKSETSKIKSEAKNKTIGYILAGFSLVAGLAWNDAIKSLIEDVFTLGRDSVWAKFIYAIAITFLVVLVSAYLTRLTIKQEEAGEEK